MLNDIVGLYVAILYPAEQQLFAIRGGRIEGPHFRRQTVLQISLHGEQGAGRLVDYTNLNGAKRGILEDTDVERKLRSRSDV